jgi:hypothetical protein
MNITKKNLEYFTNIDRIFGKYYLTHGIEYLVTWRKFCHMFIDERYSRMKIWMTNENG